MERVPADSAPAKVVRSGNALPSGSTWAWRPAPPLCIGLLPQMAGLLRRREQHRRRPCQRPESQAASSTPLPVPMLPAGILPLPRSVQMRAVREAEDTARMEAESPPPSLPSPQRNRERAHRRTLRPCPLPCPEAPWAGQLDQSPGWPLLFSTIPEETGGLDWQETDGFRWTALEAEGGPLLLDALTAQAAALWESGAEGPAVALVYP